MIASIIGKTFLKAYNSKYSKDYSAKEFFEKEYFQLFFNHPKYMQWVINSPFVQMKSEQKPHLLKSEDRLKKLENLHSKIDSGEIDASIAIGYPASEVKKFATTSGLVTDIGSKHTPEEVYFSWIGGGLGIGISGGYSILFDNEDILLTLYEGWKQYRSLLNDEGLSGMRGNKINTWNGQWLNFRLGRAYSNDFDYTTLEREGVLSISTNNIEVNTISWSSLFFNVSSLLNGQTIPGYVYSLEKTNKTLGFCPFQFSSARTIRKFYSQLFGENAALEDSKDYERLYGIDIKRAFEMGAIGMQALEPDGLRKYYGDSSNIRLSKPNIKPKKDEGEEDFEVRKRTAYEKDRNNIINYRTYKTWLLAMITKNKEENLNYSREVAKALHEYRARGSKTDRVNLIQSSLLGAKSKKAFIDALVKVVEDTTTDIVKDKCGEESLEVYKELRDRVHMMNSEDFGYFVVLLKFDYAYAERELNK
ncbi:MAG: hypothetical protein ACK5L5_05530 [Bacteroidales bacterium]